MNDTFEFRRFGLLLKKTILERPIQFIGLIGFTLLATLLIYSVLLYVTDWGPAQNLAFLWGFVGGGCFLSSVAFGYFNTNASGSAYLTIPASSFEKWLCAVLITGVFFVGIFLVYFRVMDIIFVTVYHNSLDKSSTQYQQLYDAVRIYNFDNNIARQSFLLFANLTGAMLVGALYFNKLSPIKVALVYCSVLFFIYFLNLGIVYLMFKNVDNAIPFNNIAVKVRNETGIIELPAISSKIVNISFFYLIPCVLWFTAFVRLREKEI